MSNKAGIVVIDGADCSGKTTLAQKLVKEHGARYLHLGLYKDLFQHQLAAYRLAERWASRGELVVIDRHWLSEMAYGDTLRGGQTHPISLRYFDRLFLRSAALYVLCVPGDSEAHLQRFAEHRKKRYEMFDVEPMRKVIRYYKWLLSGYLTSDLDHQVNRYAQVFRDNVAKREDVMPVDVDVMIKDPSKLDYVVHSLLNQLDFLRHQQHPTGLDEQSPNLAGSSASASILMVGERANGKIRYPFYSRDDKLSSALWLNRALDQLNISEHQLCWVNAHGFSWDETSQELKTLADPKRYRFDRIVALGQTASKHLHRCGLRSNHDYKTVPHPQWARRFRYRDFSWYVETLREAMGLEAEE